MNAVVALAPERSSMFTVGGCVKEEFPFPRLGWDGEPIGEPCGPALNDPAPETLVVNLFAGPGTGKSTTAAIVFGELKKKGQSVELVHEFAKDLVWEDRHAALGFQPYVFGKQCYHVHRLLGKVDIVITDSPILLSSHIYGNGKGYSDAGLKHLALETFLKWRTLNLVIERNLDDHPFVQAGRMQTLEESQDIDERIRHELTMLGIPWELVSNASVEENAEEIITLIEGMDSLDPVWPWPKEHEYNKSNPFMTGLLD